MGLYKEQIENFSGGALRLEQHIDHLKDHHLRIDKNQSIAGDAPKTFIRKYEYGKANKSNSDKWPAFIAKVGHKWYPNESITEHLMNRLGQEYGFKMADSELFLCSGQLRFLSRYFLRKDELLVHGAEIYASFLDNDLAFVEEIENEKMSSELFTIKFTKKAIEYSFKSNTTEIFQAFLKMLLFDAIVGNNDRHFYNWGIVKDIRGRNKPVFSPIYDTARGLFWNQSENKLSKWYQSGSTAIENQIHSYSRKSKPKIGLISKPDLNHYKLVEGILNNYSSINQVFKSCLDRAIKFNEEELITEEFRYLLTPVRKHLILALLSHRKKQLKKVIF